MLIYIIFCLSLTFTINESLLHESAVIRVRSTAKDSSSTYKSPYAICGYQGGTNPGVTTQGVTTQGVTTQGVTTQGVTTQGVTTQGVTIQGVTTQGVTTQGVTIQGVTIQGVTTQGVTTQGVTTQGVTTQGVTTQVVTTQEVTTQGVTTQGVTTQGVTIQGVTTQGVTTPRVTTPEKDDLLKLVEFLEEATKNRKPGPVSLNQQYSFEDSNKPVRSKLISGHATRKNEFPWQVAITTAYGDKLLCGAAIIGPLYVLTAAHCVQGWNARWIYLRLDAWDLQGNYSVALVSEIKSHPNYSLSTYENDIAVLKLTEEIEFKDSIRPVCLPRENIVIENREATVAGWGKNKNGRWTDKLQKVTSYVITNEKCNMAWRNSIYLTNICLDSEIGGSCDGDSGGPLVMEDPENSEKYSIIGIVSYGSNICTHKNVPGVYTRVSKFIHWLQQQMT